MEVIGHQHPTEEQEFHLLPHLLERLDKTTGKTLGEEKGRPPISAGGDELQFSRAVSALVVRHAAGEYTLDNAWPEESPFGRSLTPKSERLRQPAPTRPFGKSQTPKNRGLRQPADCSFPRLVGYLMYEQL
jgi:hypothetical protein